MRSSWCHKYLYLLYMSQSCNVVQTFYPCVVFCFGIFYQRGEILEIQPCIYVLLVPLFRRKYSIHSFPLRFLRLYSNRNLTGERLQIFICLDNQRPTLNDFIVELELFALFLSSFWKLLRIISIRRQIAIFVQSKKKRYLLNCYFYCELDVWWCELIIISHNLNNLVLMHIAHSNGILFSIEK